MAVMTSWIRQYSLRDLLDDSFDLFKEKAISLTVVGAIPYLFFLAFAVLIRTVYIPENFVNNWTMDTPWQLLSNPRFRQYIFGMVFFGTLAFSFSYLAQCRVAIAFAEGNVISVGKAFSRLIKAFFSLLLTSIIFSAFVSAVFVLYFIIAFVAFFVMVAIGSNMGSSSEGVYIIIGVLSFLVSILISFAMISTVNFLLAYILSSPIVMLNENAGPFVAAGEAMKLARANFKAHFWSTQVVMLMSLVIWALLLGVQMILFMVIRPYAPTMDNTLVGSLGSGLSIILFLGLVSCLQTLAYLDGKSRTESYDLLIMARQIGLESEFRRAFSAASTSPLANYGRQVGYPDYSKVPANQSNSYLPAATPVIVANPDYSAPPPVVAAAVVSAPELIVNPDYSSSPSHPVKETEQEVPVVTEAYEQKDGDQQHEA